MPNYFIPFPYITKSFLHTSFQCPKKRYEHLFDPMSRLYRPLQVTRLREVSLSPT